MSRRTRNPLLIFASRKSTKIKRKKRIPQDAQSLERPSERTVFPFCLFWLKPGPNTGFQKGEFRACGLDQPARLDRAGPQARTRSRLRAGLLPFCVLNRDRTRQIPDKSYTDHAWKWSRTVRAWTEPEHQRQPYQYYGLPDTWQPFRRRPDRHGQADRSAR